ncbi:MAG: pantoate--beta-alanine ligase [Elusimicrobia bacterium RIFOXYA2_FULL_40_6]|nr:MAG: pantoate--beta-alanine ligase [Elusimicrobia bacterium RIFOXYA2_FULL_40_6]
MKVIKNISLMQQIVKTLHTKHKTIGLVPTMGALHEGHISLVKKARKENDIVIVSIFVNPAQFGPKEDYLRYPRPFNKDSKLCKQNGIDYIFNPTVKEMYPADYLTYVKVEKMSDILCGKFRPGHFKGVATIVAKLFNITQPDRAYFGEKDFQQLTIIKKMVSDLNFPVKIVPCPTLREKDGLAMSSRNIYLKPEERKVANKIHRSLSNVKDIVKKKNERNIKKLLSELKSQLGSTPGLKNQYINIIKPLTLEEEKNDIHYPARIVFAGYLGKTRLIDNIEIKEQTK